MWLDRGQTAVKPRSNRAVKLARLAADCGLGRGWRVLRRSAGKGVGGKRSKQSLGRDMRLRETDPGVVVEENFRGKGEEGSKGEE